LSLKGLQHDKYKHLTKGRSSKRDETIEVLIFKMTSWCNYIIWNDKI